MFNKRESSPAEAERSAADTPTRSTQEQSSASAHKGPGAIIGASIHVDGTLKGNEDLLIQGNVKGTVELKNNSVTIGGSGQVNADIYAHTIVVEGQLEGKLIASERVMIRKTAQIKGTIVAPRVTLEDGARFNGSIDMDPETEALKAAFSPGNSISAKAGQKAIESVPSRPATDKKSEQQPAKSLL